MGKACGRVEGKIIVKHFQEFLASGRLTLYYCCCCSCYYCYYYNYIFLNEDFLQTMFQLKIITLVNEILNRVVISREVCGGQLDLIASLKLFPLWTHLSSYPRLATNYCSFQLLKTTLNYFFKYKSCFIHSNGRQLSHNRKTIFKINPNCSFFKKMYAILKEVGKAITVA